MFSDLTGWAHVQIGTDRSPDKINKTTMKRFSVILVRSPAGFLLAVRAWAIHPRSRVHAVTQATPSPNNRTGPPRACRTRRIQHDLRWGASAANRIARQNAPCAEFSPPCFSNAP